MACDQECPVVDMGVRAIRRRTIETWREAADAAELFATVFERAGVQMSGPEGCRRLAEIFRQGADAIQDDADEKGI